MAIVLDTELDVAIEAAQMAGAVMQEWRRRKYKVHFKEKGEKVTSADVLAGRKITKILNDAFGPQNILSEEAGISVGKGDLFWIVDPLDGTNNFFAGRNEVNVAIAAIRNSQPVLGVVYAPFTGELYSASYRQGAYLNGTRISCSAKERLKDLVVYAELNSEESLRNALPKIIEQLPVKNWIELSSSNLAEARTAAGAGDAFLKLGIKTWDAAAGHAILRESGCAVTDCFGNPFMYNIKQIIEAGKKSRNTLGMLAAPPALHTELVRMVSEIRKKMKV